MIISYGVQNDSRTPPGVRELKQKQEGGRLLITGVAPLPGCVN